MKSPKFKTVKQPPNSMVCVAAVAAMATGKSLKYVEKQMTPTYYLDTGKHYYRIAELLKYLGGCSVQCGASAYTGGPLDINSDDAIRLEVPMSNPLIITVDSQTHPGEWCHYIFWDGQRVRDSNPDVRKSKLSDYEILEVMPLVYIEEDE